MRGNIIIDADLMATRIVGHPFKFDSKWLGNENSEDALTWNVFRSLQEARCLAQIASQITGLDIKEEPRLYLWGICLTEDTFEPWDLLIEARKRFESKLPVKRPLTEPDIALYLPGYYLILIEAKFTSSNSCYIDGPRQNTKSLTKDELLDIYQDPALHMLNMEKARHADRVYYQLWRNTVFAEWMALADGKGTLAYHTSLTRESEENESCDHFRGLMNPELAGRFAHLSWEDIYSGIADSVGQSLVRQYLETKTSGLVQALKCPSRM